MNELHLREPVWYGDRSDPCIGVARFRLLKNGQPRKGFIQIWIDYKEKADTPAGYKLVYPYPYRITHAEALSYPIQYLNDYNHTALHIIPISKLVELKTRRKRTMSQDEFNKLVEYGRLNEPRITNNTL